MAHESNIDVHSFQSSYREALVEYLFVGELLRHFWPRRVEVMKPAVDDGGYDLVLECGGIVRHIQLKTSARASSTSKQKAHIRLESKPSGCVIWIQFASETFELGPFLWFGGPPGQRLPDLTRFRAARHTKANSAGEKRERPSIREIPKGQFVKLPTIFEVADALFGS